jgi:hypothetical protein
MNQEEWDVMAMEDANLQNEEHVQRCIIKAAYFRDILLSPRNLRTKLRPTDITIDVAIDADVEHYALTQETIALATRLRVKIYTLEDPPWTPTSNG